MLRDRTETVLKLLVDEYISTATPVTSEGIARRAPIKVSPATVRHEMSDLADQGYITRSHPSAGGIPSDKGYRFYVEAIPEPYGPPEEARQHIRTQFSQVARDMEAWTQQAAAVLASIADNMAIVTVPRASASRIKYLQLVRLEGLFALLIVVLQEATLRQHLVPLAELLSQQELTEVANRLNETFAGLTYNEIEARGIALGPLEETVMEDAVSILRNVETETTMNHYADGLRHLLNKPEFAEGGKAGKLVEVLEEPARLHSLLSQAPEGHSLGVFIGEENAEEALHPFGIILCQYGIPHEASGIVGVVGPTRMEYPTIMGGVKFLASFLSNLVAGIHRPS